MHRLVTLHQVGVRLPVGRLPPIDADPGRLGLILLLREAGVQWEISRARTAVAATGLDRSVACLCDPLAVSGWKSQTLLWRGLVLASPWGAGRRFLPPATWRNGNLCALPHRPLQYANGY